MRSAGVSSMKKLRCSSSRLTDSTRSKSVLISSPLRIFSDGISACSESMRVASCSADISSEKKPTTAPSTTLGAPSTMLLAIGPGGVEGDVGGERAFAHRGPAGQDDQVGPVQAAQQLVELDEARGHAGELADAVVGRLGRHRRLGEGGAERLEAALGLAGAGEVVELLLGASRSAAAPSPRRRQPKAPLTTPSPRSISWRRR